MTYTTKVSKFRFGELTKLKLSTEFFSYPNHSSKMLLDAEEHLHYKQARSDANEISKGKWGICSPHAG